MGVRIDKVVAGVQQAKTTKTIDPAKFAGGAEDSAPSGEGQFKQALEKASQPKKAERQDKPAQTEKSQKPQKSEAKKAAKGKGTSGDQPATDATDTTDGENGASIDQQGGLPIIPIAADQATGAVIPEQHETDSDGASPESADAINAEVAMSATITAPVQATAATPANSTTAEASEQSVDEVATIVKPADNSPAKPAEQKPGGQAAEELPDDAPAAERPIETVAKKSSREETPDDNQHQPSADVVADQQPEAKAKPAPKPASPFAEAIQSAVAQSKSQSASPHSDQPASAQQQPEVAVPTLNLDPAMANPPAQHAAPVSAPKPPAPAPEMRFAETNHPQIVTAVRSELLPNGGSMLLRLDPPDLGPMRLEVTMQDGAMTASFVTASDKAASLLSHSLGSLKQSLEAAGVSVDKLQVKQGSHEQFSPDSSADGRNGQSGANDQPSARHEQQRREMLNRMWRKVSGAGDPLDLVA